MPLRDITAPMRPEMTIGGRWWSLAVAATALTAVWACGSAQVSTDKERPVGAGEVLPLDQEVALAELDTKGVAFSPEAVGLPAMPAVSSKGKQPNLARLRKSASKPRPRPADVRLLAATLWQQADELPADNSERARQLRVEARDALRRLSETRPEQVEVDTLAMLGTAEMSLGGHQEAITAYEKLLAGQPDAEMRAAIEVWLAYLYSLTGRHGDAAALASKWDLDGLTDTGAYVAAWSAFVSGDGPRARDAIARAAGKWRDANLRPVVDRDLVLILARTGTEVAEADRVIVEVVGGDMASRYRHDFNLSEAYKFAGRYDHASDTLEHVITKVLPGDMPPDDLVGFRYRQADYAFRRDLPVEAAGFAIAAHKALEACGEACAAMVEPITSRLLKLAQLSHTTYVRSLDPRHLEGARVLYDYYMGLDGRSDTETARGYKRDLEESASSADPNKGKHDTETISRAVQARREVLGACYERALLVEPELSGTLTVSIEVDSSGSVTGATSDPPAGERGLASVGGCVTERVRQWRFPSRTVPGKTLVTVPIRLSIYRPEQAEPEAAN